MKTLTIVALFLSSVLSAEEPTIRTDVKEALEYLVVEGSNYHKNRFLIAEEKEEKTIWVYWLEDRALMRFDEGQIHPKEFYFSRISYQLGINTVQTKEDITIGSTFQMTDDWFMRKVIFCYDNGTPFTITKK